MDIVKKQLFGPCEYINCSSDCMVSVVNEIIRTFGRDTAPLGSFLRLLFSNSSLLRLYLDYPGSVLPADITEPVALSRLCKVVELQRVRLVHSSVNEVHLLLCLLESHPVGAELAMRPLIEQYRQNNPSGSRGQEFFCKAILPRLSQIPTAVRDFLDKTPFEPSKVIESLKVYLESEFYPYDSDSWARFRDGRLRKWNRKDDISLISPLHAFVAHGVAKPF